jgi:hypothetical protein
MKNQALNSTVRYICAQAITFFMLFVGSVLQASLMKYYFWKGNNPAFSFTSGVPWPRSAIVRRIRTLHA